MRERINYNEIEDTSMLTEREKEVLKMRQEGIPVEKIAEILKVKSQTIRYISWKIAKKAKGEYEAPDRKEYMKKWCEENKEKKREYGRKYYKENNEKLKKLQNEYAKKRRKEDEEFTKRQQKAWEKWYEENKEKKREYGRKYYEKNNEKLKKRQNEDEEFTKRQQKAWEKWYRKQLKFERNNQIFLKYESGKTMEEIGREYGISRQRVHAILKNERTKKGL